MSDVTVGAAPNVGRVEAGYGYRVMAAVIDGFVLYAIIFVTQIIWLNAAHVPAAPQTPAPPMFIAACVASFALYLVTTTAGGHTLGMRAVGLRVVRSDGSTGLGVRRALVRTLLLFLTIWLLGWAHPLLVVASSLWMLSNSRRQMLHDQIAGAVVVRTSIARAAGQGNHAVEPSSGGLEPTQAQALLHDLDLMRHRVRADLNMTSVPLFALALIAAGYGVAGWNPYGPLFALSLLLSTIIAPVGLLLMGWRLQRRQRGLGMGSGLGPLKVITILVTCASVLFWFIPVGGAISAVGFLVLAIVQRNGALAAAAVIFGLVAGAEQPLHFISNSVYNHVPSVASLGILEFHGSALVFALLTLALLVAGAVAFRRERSDG